MTTIIEDLKRLCCAAGCAGQQDIVENVIDMLRPYVDEIKQDAMGNIIAMRRADTPNAATVMLEAHLDEIGFLVTHIDDNGFVFVAPAGGVDKRVLSAQKVIVHGEKPIYGVFSSIPPHLSSGEDALPEITDMAIDVGLDAESARQEIPLGSRVTFAPNFTLLGSTTVSSKSLDDRAGMAAILHCLRQLKNRSVNVGTAFCVQEELGCRGAAVAAEQISPDVALVTDVSFALTGDADARQCGQMRKGAMIGISPILDQNLYRELRDVAERHNIPHQFEVMAEETGTDADNISTACCGVRTALLSIPLRYMHTPIEMIDAADIAAVGDMMAKWIEMKGAQTNG